MPFRRGCVKIYRVIPDCTLVKDGPDLHHMEHKAPWEPIPAIFQMHLPENKEFVCDPNALKADYMEIAGQLDAQANVIINIDGSVDAEGKSLAGIYAVTKCVPTTWQQLVIRVSNKTSTLQTEIPAINQALGCVNTISWHGSHHTTVLHTDIYYTVNK